MTENVILYVPTDSILGVCNVKYRHTTFNVHIWHIFLV